MSRRSSAAVRMEPGEASAPPVARRVARVGPVAVMSARWRDPDDLRPSAARTAREVQGWRQFCPLRWSRRRHGDGSRFSEAHILAADRLRWAADVALFGLSGPRDVLPVVALSYGPRAGPTVAAHRQVAAWAEFGRAMRRFDTEQRRIITGVVLLNRSIARWCAARRDLGYVADPTAETTKLVAALDLLAEHFKTDIAEDLAQGRVLPL